MKCNWPLYLYLINFALLFTHEIESAYWQEWKLFAIPGGISVFLVINFILLLVALVGLVFLLKGNAAGQYFSLLLAGAGLFAFCIHGVFILQGHPEFTLPVSMVLLGSILIVSLAQGIFVLGIMKRGKK